MITVLVEQTRISSSNEPLISVHDGYAVGDSLMRYFYSREKLQKWCDALGIKLTKVKDKSTFLYKRQEVYKSSQVIRERTYYSLDEIPSNAIKHKMFVGKTKYSLVGDRLVDCYAVLNEDGVTIYRPSRQVNEIFQMSSKKEVKQYIDDGGIIV